MYEIKQLLNKLTGETTTVASSSSLPDALKKIKEHRTNKPKTTFFLSRAKSEIEEEG